MGITAQDDSIDPGPTSGVVGPTTNELLSVLQPPHQPGSGKPAYVKRGPGRPRKDNSVGLGKAHKLGWSHKTKNLHGGLAGPSLNRGLTGRKKSDGLLSTGGTNLAVSLIGELSAISHESPPRGGNNNGGDDAAESDTSSVASSLEKLHEDFSLLPEQWPGKVCAFCNLGERSMLGQGDLLRIEIPDGFDPVAVATRLTLKNKIEKDASNEKAQKTGFSCRRQKGVGKMKRLISQSSLESMNEPVDEVCGYPEEPEYSSIFDSTSGSGYYYVHHGCANWCDGVTVKEDGVTFPNLEVEVIRSLNQRCLHCGNLGAGVVCKAPNCGAVFHLPCAAISGAFQDPSSKTVLCSSHLDLAVSLVGDKANCTVCDSPGKIAALVLCSNCDHHYHGTCMALNLDPGIRAGWQCPACKMCQACRQPGDESKLLSCDTCDKSYHIFCLRPQLSSIPKHSWKCKLCRQCTDCGARTPGSGPSSRWHANFSVCDSCYQQRNKGLACPMCGKAYRHVAQKLMLQCHKCRKYVHGTCDPAADLSTYQQKKGQHPDYEYTCKPCKTNQPGLTLPGGAPRTLSSGLKRTSEELGEDGSVLGNNTSQDSLFSPDNEPMQSTENACDSTWADKNSLEQFSYLNQPSHHQHQQTPKDNKLLNYEAKLHKRKSISGASGGGGRGKGHDRMGHYSTNSNSRRHKVSELVKKRGPKPKLRMFGRGSVHRASTDSFPKEEECQPVGVENRMILCSSRDEFVLQQDVCVMCGAYGNDLEGRLIACAQCGQCYHPYCVNVKVNRVILQKGWRCLDCTVCEGCGQRNDEARLILCDECDVSFHIYCMDPPLDSVPDGTWKCKWCVVCQYCGTNDPGRNSIWHNNYTTCGPCASYSLCPVCKAEYTDGELIIKCNSCERWIHAGCDSIKDDDEAEKCSDENYSCVLCRPSEVPPPHLRPPPPPVTKAENPPKSPDLLRTIASEGVYLSEEGNTFIKSLQMDLYVPRDKRDKRKNKKKRPISEMEAGILAVIESVVSGGAVEDKSKGEKDEENEKDIEERKRQKKLGIGGFVVRNIRGPRFKDEDEGLDQLEPGDKPKRKAQRRKVIKNKLIESFPVYLQEAFFGKPLLKPSPKETDLVVSSIDELDDSTSSFKFESTVKLTKEEIKEIEAIKLKQKSPEKAKPDNRLALETSLQHNHTQQVVAADVTKKLPPSLIDEDDSEMAFQDILTGDLLDNDFMDNIMNEGDDIKVEEGLADFRTTDDSNDFSLDQTSQDVVKDEFNDLLTSQFGLDNIDPGLPSMDSKDVEDIFNGVLIEESQEPLFSQVNTVPTVSDVASSPRVNSNQGLPPSSLQVSSPSSSLPTSLNTTGPVQASPGLPRATPLQTSLASPVNFPPPSPYPSEYSNSPQFSPAFSEPPSPWPATSSEVDSDQPNTYNQRSILKMEADEALGPNATIVSVLYANLNHPELKRDYANWNERAKQIQKIWRNLPTDKRAPYLQKARENRAASRMQKTQQDPEKLGAGAAKNARNVETQEERQWKQLQALRQQQQGGLPGADQHVKDGVVGVGPLSMQGNSPHPPFTPSSVSPLGGPRMMPPGSPGVAPGGMEGVRQPLQSPLSPSPMGRPQFPGNLQLTRARQPNMTVAMPPPSPSSIYQPRPEGVVGGQNAQNIRGPLYARLPFQHQQPRQPLPTSMQNDVYGTPPATPLSVDSIPQSPGGPSVLQDQYSHNSPLPQQQQGDGSDALGASPRPSPSPQTPEAKQHLRGLLQGPKGPNDVPSQNRPSWAHPVDDPTKLQTVVTADGQQIVQRLGTASKEHCFVKGEFRQPLLPSHVRVPANVAQLSPGHPSQQPAQRQPPPGMTEFRLGSPGMDPRARILLQHQQRSMMISSQQGLPQQQRPSGFNQFSSGSVQPPQSPSPIRSPMDPYDHIVVQQQRLPTGIPSSTSPMLAQQLGRPLSSGVAVSAPQVSPLRSVSHSSQHAAIVAATSSSNQSSNHPHHHRPSGAGAGKGSGKPEAQASRSVSPVSVPTPSATTVSEHQELPDSVTEELEKLEQEHNSDHGVEEPSELADLGMDDDELLGMGDDFNILEYADSELDDVVGGEKTNILDNLDLEEDDKEEGRKDESDIKNGEKKEPGNLTDFANLTDKSSTGSALTKVTDSLGSQPNVTHMMATSAPGFPHATGAPGGAPPPHTTHAEQLLRQPNQHQQPPPPPYPVPPPPYPGRPQEQPLLLEDLLEQEKREQQKQLPGPHGGPGLMGAAPEEPLLSDFDFERLKADVLSSSNLPVSLSPPNLVGNAIPTQQPGVFIRTATGQLSQVPVGAPPQHWMQMDAANHSQIVGQQQHQPQTLQQQPPPPPGAMEVVHGSLGSVLQQGPPGTQMRMNLTTLPPPPNPPEHATTEQDRQQQEQYEKWLYHQQSVLAMQLKTVQTEVDKLRKQKKTINCKARQLKKNNAQLSEPDNAELARIVSELQVLQKQLDQLRKQNKQHGAVTEEYQSKKQKRQQQQIMGANPGSNLGAQMSPLGPSSANSPLQHTSTPQSPMHMSNSPGMPGGPSPSPLMQHSPMASPLTPSPGPHSASLSQTSPRVGVNQGQHGGSMDDMPFSPTNDPNKRPMISGQMPQNIRIPVGGGQVQMRMSPANVGSPGGHQQIIVQQQPGGPNQVGNQPGIMIVRGLNLNMISMHQQQQMGRMRVMGPGQAEQMMKISGQMAGSHQRFQRMGISQEVLARAKGPQQFPTSMSGMPMSPAGQQQQHYSSGARVPFPTQSPNAATNMNMNMRSPSPMTPVGGLGSPQSSTSQASVMQQMVQNRVSPASSPMRRPSGSGSIGAPSPMTADRPQSVENPMTPRSTAGGSRPHTPIGSNVLQQQQQQQQHGHMEGMNVIQTSHAPPTSMDTTGTGQFNMDVYSCQPATPAPASTPSGGGGGGQNHQILPFPTFSWSSDVHKMGLKGGSPYTVVNESVQANNNNNATSSNSVADSEVATQATTITVSTNSTELNNTSHLHGAIDGEGTSNTASPPSSVSSSAVATTLAAVAGASVNSEVLSSDHGTNKTNETVPVKSVLVAVSVSSASVSINLPPAPRLASVNSSPVVSTAAPPTPLVTTTLPTPTTTATNSAPQAQHGITLQIHQHQQPGGTIVQACSGAVPTTSHAPSHLVVATSHVAGQGKVIINDSSGGTAIGGINKLTGIQYHPTTNTITVPISNAGPPTTQTEKNIQLQQQSQGESQSHNYTLTTTTTPTTPVTTSATAAATNNFPHSVAPPPPPQSAPTTTSNAPVTTSAVPVQSIPSQSIPVQSIPVQSIPAQSISTQSLPVQSIPTQSLPVQSIPTQSVPVMSIPRGAQTVSIQSIPVQSIATQNVPVQNIPAHIVSTHSVVPVQNVPTQSAPPQTVLTSSNIPMQNALLLAAVAGASKNSEVLSSDRTNETAPVKSVLVAVSVSSAPVSINLPPAPKLTSVNSSPVVSTAAPPAPSVTTTLPNPTATVTNSMPQVQHIIPFQIHKHQQPGGTIVHHTLPIVATSHVTGQGKVIINDSSGGTAIGSINNLAGLQYHPTTSTFTVPISNAGPPAAQTEKNIQLQQQSQGESQSQNALLKQLLQNTGCASMTQTSENVGFSLTSCLSRPVPASHTSHLSAAATKIPHPVTPVLRPTTPTTPVTTSATAAAVTNNFPQSVAPPPPQSAPTTTPNVPVTTSAVPAQSIPSQSIPVQSIPVQSIPAQSIPTQSLPVQTISTQSLPVQSIPTQSLPVQSIPTQSLPVQSIPTQSLPVQSIPTQSVPVMSIPRGAHTVSIQSIPVQSIATQNVPIQNIPAHIVSTHSVVSVQNIPTQSAPPQTVLTPSTVPVQTIPTQIPLTRPTIKMEAMHIEECSQPSSTPLSATPPVVETVVDVKPHITELMSSTPSSLDVSKEAIIAVVQEATQSMMQNHDSKLTEIISGVAAGAGEIPTVGSTSLSSSSASSSTTGAKKGSDEDAKKLKRRQYAAKRKQSLANNKETPVSKKRPRKVGRPEDDFDNFLENFMTQLRQLSPIGIVEPELSYTFNVCALAGVGDFSKLTQKNYSTFFGDLTGHLGKGQLPSKSDFYNTRPFGPDPPKPQPKPQPTHRGFYYQEFATPKMGAFEEKIRSDNRTPSPVRETNTPDTIVSASSPECTAWDNITMYPGLKYIDDDMSKEYERCISPEMPLLAPIPIRPVPIDPKSKQDLILAKEMNTKDMDKENKNGYMKDLNGSKLRSITPLKDAGNITVTLTLSSAAAEDIRGLLRNLANVLSIAAPTYQVIDKGGSGSSSASSIMSEQKSHLYTIKGKDGKEKIDIQSILNGAAKFCRHCDVVVLNNVIRKKVTDFPGIAATQLNGGEGVVVDADFSFCSTNCLMQFSITNGFHIPQEDKAAAIVTHPGGDQLKTIKTENDGRLNNKNKNSAGDFGKVKIKQEVITGDPAQKQEKRWKGTKYRTWGSTFLPPTRYKKPTDKEVTELLFRMGITAMPPKLPLDSRECIFCHLPGDGVSDGPGRLLNFDVDKWVHLNCALWSDDVYETENGALVNVELALKQSLTLACVFCNKKGATVKCFKTRCSSVYHLGCATKEGCIFYKNKTIYCPAHIPKGEKENELATLSVYRRVYVQRDENKQVAAVMHHADQHHLLRVGSLIFLNVGQLLPHQLQAFHTPNFIYPIGYKIARFYWSMRKVNKRCQYICSIHDVDGKPEFRIAAQEDGYKEHVVKASTAQAAWSQILETISRLRNCAEIIRVFPKYITGEDLFGLTEPSIVKVLESLPGIETLTDYHFKYGRNPLLELPLAINPTGCARSEPKLRTHFKRPQTQRTRPSRSTLSTSTVMSSEAACPYSKQFVHSKSSQYKKMKQEWRNNVYLARSKIQGLGLYAARDIERHTMVIEYIGEIIRPELAELREKKYEAQNRGIYMFRLDENRVIDATLCGGLARYINHSCNPNCVAETVEVDRDLRIIIFANRRISRGEELSYDYKFEVEDDQHKIPCLCGAPNCQQWMN